METRFSERSLLTKPTQRHTPEDDILHSHRCKILKSYTFFLHSFSGSPANAVAVDHLVTQFSVTHKKTKFRGLSPRANYTDRAIPLVGEVMPISADRGVSRGQCNGSPKPFSRLSIPKPLLFILSSSSIVLTRLSGSRSRPNTSQEIWYGRESNRDLWIGSQEL
jgi:hypothetical protein